jgi:hypothetical protein
MRRLIVRGYLARNAVRNCEENAHVHAQVLRKYDIANITSAKTGWWHDPETVVLLLEDAATAEPLGAVRLQRFSADRPLPLETALAGIDPRVHARVASFAREGVGELCGLWCSPQVKGYGLGAVLTRMGLSLALATGTTTIFGVCDTRLLTQNLKLGFLRDHALASHGAFEYPRPGLVAHVLCMPDAQHLGSATLEERTAIEDYRARPFGRELLEGPAGRIELVRHLGVRSASKPAAQTGRFARVLAPIQSALSRLFEEPA